MTRIQVSKNLRMIYTGGEQMAALTLEGERYRIVDIGSEVEPFIDAKLLETGDLVTFEKRSSDLVLFDTNLNEINRLRGKRPIDLGIYNSDLIRYC